MKRVLVMFKCHFDAGFIDTQYNVVHQRYFDKYFPQAIEIARAANAGGKRRYVWTTGSWLLFEYLEQASAADRKTMEEAIARGDIAWHALPFTWQTEMLDPSMIEGSLALSQSLDRRFGKVTTGAKMTDVPGHTRGIIPPLAKHGVTFLEIGVNGGSTRGAVAADFSVEGSLGREPADDVSLGIRRRCGCSRVGLAVVTRVRGDNSGPHTADEIAQIHADLAARFPNAEITARNLSEMANAIAPYRDKLPVVTEEIGDTWIHGCASDPLKVARYREVARLREEWIAQGALQVGDATDVELLRHVLLEAEHTWGTDTKTWLDFDNYKPADLARMLDTKKYKVVEFSWIEKRQDLLDGVATLPEALREEAQLAIEGAGRRCGRSCRPRRLRMQRDKPIETEHFIVGIDAKTGAITRLRNKATGREWASAKNPIALFTYQTLSQEDYQRFMGKLSDDEGGLGAEGFWQAEHRAVWREAARSGMRSRPLCMWKRRTRRTAFLWSCELKDDAAFDSGRAAFPRHVFVELVLPKAEPVIQLNLSWFGKPATRMPEALWLTFNPIAEDEKGWTLDKTGEAISPFDVVASGNRHMHCLQKGFEYQAGRASLCGGDAGCAGGGAGRENAAAFLERAARLEQGNPLVPLQQCLGNELHHVVWRGRARAVRVARVREGVGSLKISCRGYLGNRFGRIIVGLTRYRVLAARRVRGSALVPLSEQTERELRRP